MLNENLSPQETSENDFDYLKMSNKPYTEDELADRKELKKGEKLLENTMDLFRAKLEILEERNLINKGEALKLYQLLLKDKEKQNKLKKKLTENDENLNNDNREEIVRKLIMDNTGIVFNE